MCLIRINRPLPRFVSSDHHVYLGQLRHDRSIHTRFNSYVGSGKAPFDVTDNLTDELTGTDGDGLTRSLINPLGSFGERSSSEEFKSYVESARAITSFDYTISLKSNCSTYTTHFRLTNRTPWEPHEGAREPLQCDVFTKLKTRTK